MRIQPSSLFFAAAVVGACALPGIAAQPAPQGTGPTDYHVSAAPIYPPPPRQAEEVSLPQPAPTWWDRRNLGFYKEHTLNHGVVSRHHGRFWQFQNGQHHGWMYGCSSYQPRAAGATYTFGEWSPRRSFYYAYQPCQPNLPYGFSPEPYYNTQN